MIGAGHAYVDESSAEEIRAGRGTLTEPGTNSPWRERPIAESLSLFTPDQPELAPADVARRLRLPRSTAYRLLGLPGALDGHAADAAAMALTALSRAGIPLVRMREAVG